jgi:hypothetical protein
MEECEGSWTLIVIKIKKNQKVMTNGIRIGEEVQTESVDVNVLRESHLQHL